MRGFYVHVGKDRITRQWLVNLCTGRGRVIAHLDTKLTYDQARRSAIRYTDRVRQIGIRYLTKGYR